MKCGTIFCARCFDMSPTITSRKRYDEFLNNFARDPRFEVKGVVADTACTTSAPTNRHGALRSGSSMRLFALVCN
jgi:hypothetical protein